MLITVTTTTVPVIPTKDVVKVMILQLVPTAALQQRATAIIPVHAEALIVRTMATRLIQAAVQAARTARLLRKVQAILPALVEVQPALTAIKAAVHTATSGAVLIATTTARILTAIATVTAAEAATVAQAQVTAVQAVAAAQVQAVAAAAHHADHVSSKSLVSD